MMRTTYKQAYESAQAGGMNETDSHDFASEQAERSRPTTQTVLDKLQPFIGHNQRHAVMCGLRGEEKQFFAEKLAELAGIVEAMPKTGETDGQGDAAIAYLHYFAGGQASWWITEKDIGSPDDEIPGRQHQAFGLADLFQDGGEVGYISIAEILANGGELDMYFTPKTLAEIQSKAVQVSG